MSTLWEHNVQLPGLRPGKYLTLQEQFEEWLDTDDGVTVYEEVIRRARALRGRGFRHFGIKALWEAIRYDRAIQLGPNAGFKINNNFHSRMARLVMDRCPDLADFFETRELKA